jgi:hypothetical protein
MEACESPADLVTVMGVVSTTGGVTGAGAEMEIAGGSSGLVDGGVLTDASGFLLLFLEEVVVAVLVSEAVFFPEGAAVLERGEVLERTAVFVTDAVLGREAVVPEVEFVPGGAFVPLAVELFTAVLSAVVVL